MDRPTGQTPSLFLPEAVRHYLREAEGRNVLRVSPPWSWALMWTCGALVVSALVFSILGRVEVNDRGKGILRPVGGVRLLAAPTGGVVAERRANPGDLVPAGAPVLRLESPELKGSVLEAGTRLRLLSGDFQGVASQQEALYERQAKDLQARKAAAAQDLESFVHSVEIQERKYKASQELKRQGIIGQLELEGAEEQLEAARRQHRGGVQTLKQVQQDIVSLETQHRLQVYNRKSDLEEARTHAEAVGLSEGQTAVSAPVQGYVDALAVRPGDRVQPGQVLAKLVPKDSPVHVVSFLPEKNRAFVHAGDRVHLELSQYPYAEFGTLRGRVTRVGGDLASSAEWREAMGDEAQPEGPSFRVEIEVEPPAEGPLKEAQMRPGMLLNVRYTLRRQSLITFVFDPLRRWLR